MRPFNFHQRILVCLGFGVRAGFLGLLHMDIVKERLEREYGLSLIITNPSTDYMVTLMNNEEITIQSAADLPDMSKVKEIKEPWVKGEIVCPKDLRWQRASVAYG